MSRTPTIERVSGLYHRVKASIVARLRFRLLVPTIRTARIARFGDAPVLSRVQLIMLPRLRRLRSPRSVGLDVGRVHFDTEIDVRAFDEVFFAGTYETDYLGAVVVDIGAHKGYYSGFAILQGAAQVESFEPSPANAAALRRTAETFDGRCTVHEAAVGAVDGEATLNLSDESWRHSLLPIESTSSVRVKVASLTGILARLGRHRQVIVKIDAEGAECDIVLRTPTSAWEPVDEVFVEHHAFAECTREEVVRRLQLAGFQASGRRRGAVAHYWRRERDVPDRPRFRVRRTRRPDRVGAA